MWHKCVLEGCRRCYVNFYRNCLRKIPTQRVVLTCQERAAARSSAPSTSQFAPERIECFWPPSHPATTSRWADGADYAILCGG